jgi:hypothetical protein
MKNFFSVMLVLLSISSVLTSCKDDEDDEKKMEISATLNVNAALVTQEAILVNSHINNYVATEITKVGFCYDTVSNPDVNKTMVMSVVVGDTGCVATISGLKAETKYYVKAFAQNDDVVKYSEEIEVSTLPYEIYVLTNSLSEITEKGVTLTGETLATNKADIEEYGFAVSQDSIVDENDVLYTVGSGIGSFQVTIDNLLPLTNYFVKAYAKSGSNYGWGEALSFTTLTELKPEFSNIAASEIDAFSAKISAQLLVNNNPIEKVFLSYYSESAPGNVSVHHTTDVQEQVEFQIDGLIPETKYFVKFAVMVGEQTYYSEEISFTTSKADEVYYLLVGKDGETPVWKWQDGERCQSIGPKSHFYNEAGAENDIFDEFDDSWWWNESASQEALDDEYSFTASNFTCDYKETGLFWNFAWAHWLWGEEVALYEDKFLSKGDYEGKWELLVYEHTSGTEAQTIVMDEPVAKSYVVRIYDNVYWGYGSTTNPAVNYVDYQICHIWSNEIWVRHDNSKHMDKEIPASWLEQGYGIEPEWGYFKMKRKE